MKEIVENNYSWLDIIEPTILESSGFIWGYYLISFLVVIGIILLNKYFNIWLRFNFWLLLFKLKKNGDTRKISKKTLKLLSLEKNTTYTMKYLTAMDKNTINECRTELLGACYSKKPKNIVEIQNTLDKFSKWL